VSLSGKTIVLGVTGGIAAYKAVEIVSRLRKLNAAVQVIMTASAAHFVTPLTFREMSGNPVVVSMWEESQQWNVEHIALATMADAFLIAPATANIIGKIASGIADDMLSTTVMATTAPVIFAPAMNTQMFCNPIVQKNITSLKALGYHFMEPASGVLACGTEGVGRLPEPCDIVNFVVRLFAVQQDLAGKKVLVTAGGTREAIDPVRYIGNRSSGKMGYAIAKEAASRGAQVILVSGPTCLPQPPQIVFRAVESAAEMRREVLKHFTACDIIVKAAAVADYRPAVVATQKIKKNVDSAFTLEFAKNPDILHELGQLKDKQFLVGFAAETQNLVAYATKKLEEKNLDMIVANDVTALGAGFNVDTNIAKLLFRDGTVIDLPQMTKELLARCILDYVCKLISKTA
jgi:phosphopantothenoylcysteine decarboxylase/phosphopantothenate--cysteine ligase